MISIEERCQEIEHARIRKWNSTFAWFPVVTEDCYIVWLQTVYRCKRHRFDDWRYLGDVHNIMTVPNCEKSDS